MSKYLIRNSFAVGACITVFVIIGIFFSGSPLYERLQGEWVSVENADKIIFINNKYTRDSESGVYRIYGNRIVLQKSGDEFLVTVKREHMVLDGVHYLRR